jgi:hypothetical protein
MGQQSAPHRAAPTQAPPPSKLLADDLRLRADRLREIRHNLAFEEMDLRDAADRIERGGQ